MPPGTEFQQEKFRALMERARAYELEHYFDSALISFHHAINLAKKEGLETELCDALIEYGSLLGKTGQVEQCIASFHSARLIADNNSLKKQLGQALFGLGTVYSIIEKNDTATFFLLNALNILEEEKDLKSVNAIKNNLSILARRKGDFKNGLNLLKQAIQGNKQRGDTISLIGNLRNLGLALLETGEMDSALFYLNKSYLLGNKLQSIGDMISAQSGLAKIHVKNGDESSALRSFMITDSLITSFLHRDQTSKVLELETKFRTAEIERDNAVKQARIELQERRMIFLYSIAGFLILGICAVYVYNEQRKKIIRTLALQKEQENRKQIQELLSQQELKSAYAMLAGQEKAHKRIAEELHDNLGSILVTLNMFADSLQKKTEPEALKELAKKISGAAELANETTRKISHSLHSGVLKHFGLATAVKELIDALNESHTITVESHIQIDKKLDSEISLNIYRILQELINNTLKHAKASKIHIDLTQINERISLIYEDNGIGFEAGPDKGLGLRNLESRVERLNGELTIDSKPGKGTTTIIEIAIP